MLPVSVDCPLLIALSVFSNVYLDILKQKEKTGTLLTSMAK